MGFMNRLLSPLFKLNSQPSTDKRNLFSFLLGTAAPDSKLIEYQDAYKGWVYTCTNAIAEDVAMITSTLRLERFTSQGWVEQENHIALDLLFDVNPFMSSFDLFLYTQSYLELSGECFWYMPKGSVTRKPAEIWILDPSRMAIAKDNKNYIAGYVYTNEKREQIPLDPNEVLHMKRFNPRNRYRGMGTVQAAAVAIDTDTYSADFNKNFFFNAAMPSATLETDGTLTKEQLDRVKAEWNDRYTGVSNAHKLAILQGGLHFNPVQMAHKDMEFLEQRRYSRDEIMAIFRVPKTVIGISEDVNRANAEATEYVFAKRVIKPRMEFLIAQLNEFFLPLFNEDSKKIRFQYDDPVPQNEELNLKKYETGIKSGYFTINEVREEHGLDPVDGGDTPYIAFNMIPLSGNKKKEGTGGQDDQNQDDSGDSGGSSSGKVRGKSLLKGKKERAKLSDMRVVVHPTQKTVLPIMKEERSEEAESLLTEQEKYTEPAIKEATASYSELMNDMKQDLTRKLKNAKSKKKVEKKDEQLQILIDVVFEGFEDWVKEFKKRADSVGLEMYTIAGKLMFDRMAEDGTFDVKHPRAIEFLRKFGAEEAKTITDTMRQEVRDILANGVDNAQTVDEIADSLKVFFDEKGAYKAERIARTEVIRAYGEGSLEGARQSGVVTQKEWILGRTDACPICTANRDQKKIALDDEFQSGHHVQPAHPNCVCTVIYHVD